MEPKTKQSTIRLEKDLSQRITQKCQQEQISREVFLEALFVQFEKNKALQSKVLKEARQRDEQRRKIANYRRAKSMIEKIWQPLTNLILGRVKRQVVWKPAIPLLNEESIAKVLRREASPLGQPETQAEQGLSIPTTPSIPNNKITNEKNNRGENSSINNGGVFIY